jgi:hypothetical protein
MSSHLRTALLLACCAFALPIQDKLNLGPASNDDGGLFGKIGAGPSTANPYVAATF